MNVTRICAQVIVSLVLLVSVPAKSMNYMPAMGKRELCIVGGAVAAYGLYRGATYLLKKNRPIGGTFKVSGVHMAQKNKSKKCTLSSLMSASLKARYVQKGADNTEALNVDAVVAALERDALLEESVAASPVTKERFKGFDPMSTVDYVNPLDKKMNLVKISLWRQELLHFIWDAPSKWTGLSDSFIATAPVKV